MSDDVHDRFEALMADRTTEMAIVTTASGGVRAGCLVGFHVQCGIEPPAYAIWLSKANHTYRIGALSSTFAVHFPTPEHHDLAALFGGVTGDEVDKFDQCAWTEGPDGVPLLDDVPDRFVGRRTALLDHLADHVCVTLEPVAADHMGAGRPLTMSDVDDVEPGKRAEERQRPR